MKKRQGPVHALLGCVSIILILTVLSLVALSVLALTRASNDARIADKNAQYTQAAYEARADAVRYMAKVRECGNAGEYESDFPVLDSSVLHLRFSLSEDGKISVLNHTIRSVSQDGGFEIF